MVGLGTVVNVALILAGGLIGTAFGRFFTPRIQDSLLKATAAGILFAGISGAMGGMLSIGGGRLVGGGTALVVLSLAIGSLIGEALDLDRQIGRFGEWLKYATSSSGDPKFVDAFVAASLTVAVGAMSIVGAIQDGIAGDWSTLALKGAIDALLICTMTASMGRGCIFSAIPVLVFQGTIALLARLLQPIMPSAAVGNLSTVGSILIFCVGVNLIWGTKFRVANMLPALIVAVAAAFVL